jgi:hypothetical protein
MLPDSLYSITEISHKIRTIRRQLTLLHEEGGGQGQDQVLGQVGVEIVPVWVLEEEQGEEEVGMPLVRTRGSLEVFPGCGPGEKWRSMVIPVGRGRGEGESGGRSPGFAFPGGDWAGDIILIGYDKN